MERLRICQYVTYDDEDNEVYVAEIQVRNFIFWHTVTQIEDDDQEYVKNRAEEILDILSNPNR